MAGLTTADEPLASGEASAVPGAEIGDAGATVPVRWGE